MPARRRTLAVLAGALASSSGCLSGLLDDDPPLEHGDEVRATGDPISRSVDGGSPDFAYVPGNDTVRDETDDDTRYHSPAVWAAWIGSSHALDAISEQFDPPLGNRGGVDLTTWGAGRDMRLIARHQTRYHDYETRTIDPEISTTTLVEDLPATVEQTVSLDDQAWTIDFQVYVQRRNYIEHPPDDLETRP